MRRVMHARPSPAIVIAILALVAGVTGAAYAGGKPVTKNKAKKIANKQINKKAPKLSVANADTVGELAPGELESHAFTNTSTSATLPSGAGTTTVQTLDLDAGRYLIVARGEINNNGAATTGPNCRVIADADEGVLARNLRMAANLSPGETYPASGQIVHTFDAAGQARIDCTRPATWSAGNVLNPTISAVSVQP